MIDIIALRGEILRAGLHQTDVARALNMNPKTFYAKMKRGVFGSDEIQGMVDLLKLKNPARIFFVNW